MPKAASTTFTHVHAGDWRSPNNPHALKRNQACHQCRKRKLKCDAKRPCTTCIRSHAYALAHAPPGATMPAGPDCTYDLVPNLSGLLQQDPPEGRLEKLETRIAELEALLAESHEEAGPSSFPGPLHFGGPPQLGGHPQLGVPGPSHIPIDPALLPGPDLEARTLIYQGPFTSTPDSVIDPLLTGGYDMSQHLQAGALNSLAEAAALSVNDQDMQIEESVALHVPRPHPVEEVFALGWSKNLPSPELLRHLVDAYFSFNADASRLLHRPTFMADLSLPPTHPRFPSTALLHAICAIGSFYTAAVDPSPNPTKSPFPMDDPFDSRHWMHGRKPYSFAEVQVQHANTAILSASSVGEDIIQGLQAEIILSTWYWTSAKWAAAYMSIARSLRTCLPMGLNVAAPFHPISGSARPPSLLPPANSVLEEELRRNTFWLAYALERTMGSGHGWALMLDDQDISQMLPVCGEDFEEMRSVATHERQWSHDHDVLIRHPPRQTDPFVLYIKSCMLLSRVKNFNARFRAKYYAGDPSTFTVDPNGQSTPSQDIRHTPAFSELNQLITDFQSSIPPHLKRPVKNGVVNAHLFSACTIAHLAVILLHETHAHIESKTCHSSLNILNAARGILNLMYDVCATSYNLSLLGQFVVVSSARQSRLGLLTSSHIGCVVHGWSSAHPLPTRCRSVKSSATNGNADRRARFHTVRS
ncbi:uncharacterized protein C8Q71DRAFT_746053 [Rhodofomes roseus]|uniref:Zn(2)-C6 fungal-type domain-containing protein n=1 Tax=Rhodofomes roseus TaxID=34475 RepID=A0ABQ8KPP4_9APHY|nr:uncharacterized protein C8Q71DRAFT_746053 [Rhodofomes roseus]KAH9840158.1 hypothetical protein C8Q71DRAFT_746053 [Rhodofomes roseus]